MHRIIDLRDPDDYISFNVYADCVKRAEEATNREIETLEKEANEKLSKIGVTLLIEKEKVLYDRTFANIFFLISGEKKKMCCCNLSGGESLKKCVQNCIKDIICKHFEISLTGA